VILVITSLPGSELALADSWSFPGSDKLLHAAMYAVLGALSARAAAVPPRALAPILLAIALFAALDEWHQVLVPGRSADALDWLADILGAITGAASAALRLQQTT
jgi:VanZ family protein